CLYFCIYILLYFCHLYYDFYFFFFFQAEDGIRDFHVTGVQTCALPIFLKQNSRAVLLKKPVTFTYRDKSMDDVLEELILLRRELNYIGNNFNQAVYKLNSVSGMPEAKLWQEALTVLRDQLEPSLREIKVRLDDYSEIWTGNRDFRSQRTRENL